ncbi:hypothetical protein GCM10027594_14200 [Hymenobacter agri]
MSQFLTVACLAAVFYSQKPSTPKEPWVAKDVLILQSTKDYKAALATARQAATRLHATLNLEGYLPNAQAGLTMSRADCAANGFDYPAYVARGRENEEAPFVSIEFSNGYNGFVKGYYLVIAGVSEPGSRQVRQTETLAKQWYPTAYLKQTQVWLGCIH